MTKQDKQKYLNYLSSCLNKYYETIQSHKNIETNKSYIKGLMAGGMYSSLVTVQELNKIIEETHYEFFGKSQQERKIENALTSGDEEDWSYFDTPAKKRNSS